MDPIQAGTTAVPDDDRRTRGRRFARVGRVLPVALVQIVGTLLASRITGPTAVAGGGPPWSRHGLVASVVDPAQPGPLAVALLVAGVLVLPWRWRWPRSVLVVTFVTTVGYALLVSPRGPFVAALTMAIVNAWLRGRRTTAVVFAALAAGVLPTADVLTGRSGAVGPDAALVSVAWVAVTLSVAELVRVRLERVAERRRRRVEAEQQRARDERVRIARELHDSVAHGMSLITLQAGVALHLGDELPEPVRRSLTDIRDTSRDALVELRTILGVLRSVDGTGDDGTPARTPTAGLDRLPDLADRALAAGLDVSVERVGDVSAPDGTTDRNAFRIVQEALTNVMKHAPGNRVEITVRVGPDTVDLVVEDHPGPDPGSDRATAARRDPAVGPAPSPLLGATGNGLIGMRERANAVGGSLVAGPTPGRGWRVTAQLPVGTAAPAAAPAAPAAPASAAAPAAPVSAASRGPAASAGSAAPVEPAGIPDRTRAETEDPA